MEEFHIEMVAPPQTEEWRDKINEVTENNTSPGVLMPDSENPHKPWLFVPLQFLKSDDQTVSAVNTFARYFQEVFEEEFKGNYGQDGLNFLFDLPARTTKDQIEAITSLIKSN